MGMVMEFFKMIFESYKKVLLEGVDNYCKKYIDKPMPIEAVDSKPYIAELCETKLIESNGDNSNLPQPSPIPVSSSVNKVFLGLRVESVNKENDGKSTKAMNRDKGMERDRGNQGQLNEPNGMTLKERFKICKRKLTIRMLCLNTFCICAECGEYSI